MKSQMSQVYVDVVFYLYTVSYKAITLLRDTFTYFNYVSIRDSLWVQHLFLSDKKTEEFSGYIHEYLAKVKSIPSLQMHDLLEILEHAFSLLVDFSSIHITTCYIYNNIHGQSCCVQIIHFIVIRCLYVSKKNKIYI